MNSLDKYEFNSLENTIFYLCLLILGLILSLLFYRSIIFSFVIFVFSKRIKLFVIQNIVERRRRRFYEEFKDFLFFSATSIGSGRSMKDAISESIPSIISVHGEASILANELKDIYERMEYGGEYDVSVLMDFAIASGLEDVVDFVSIYSICKTSGANLITALNKAASVIIDKMTIEKEIQEIVRRKESEGIVIFIMPVIVILFLNIFSPDYIAPLYDSFAGRVIMTIAIGAEIGIYGLIQRIVKVEV